MNKLHIAVRIEACIITIMTTISNIQLYNKLPLTTFISLPFAKWCQHYGSTRSSSDMLNAHIGICLNQGCHLLSNISNRNISQTIHINQCAVLLVHLDYYHSHVHNTAVLHLRISQNDNGFRKGCASVSMLYSFYPTS